MRRIVIAFLVYCPFSSIAQETGIRFEENRDWEQVKAKAKNENKIIFVDCYATWCQPCKEMDKYVYANDAVGNYANSRFVALKIQMDSTGKDDNNVKLLYPIARQFKKIYNVISLPTFLFFLPDGQIVHKDIGEKDAKQFLSLLVDVNNPGRQLYPLINNWKRGSFSYTDLPDLSNRVKVSLCDNILANEIARDYMLHYLDKLPDERFYNQQNLKFIEDFRGMIRVNDRIFHCYSKNSQKIDAIMGGADYSKENLLYVISNTYLKPAIEYANKSDTIPDWRKLYIKAKTKVGKQYSKLALARAKVRWYESKRDFKTSLKYMIQEMDMYNLSNYTNDFMLNSRSMSVFLYSDSQRELKKALTWIERALEIDQSGSSKSIESSLFTAQQNTAARLDTKANLLYKLGMIDDAIKFQEMAVKTNPESKSLKNTLQKMKSGQPTWITGK